MILVGIFIGTMTCAQPVSSVLNETSFRDNKNHLITREKVTETCLVMWWRGSIALGAVTSAVCTSQWKGEACVIGSLTVLSKCI